MAYLSPYAPGGVTTTGTGQIPTALAAVQPANGTTSSGASEPAVGGVQHATPAPSAYAWLLAWAVVLATLALINRSRIGHAAIYYALCLMLFFVIVSNYRFIATSLAPFQTLQAS